MSSSYVCPVCSADLSSLSDRSAQRHVNDCLDNGPPIAVPALASPLHDSAHAPYRGPSEDGGYSPSNNNNVFTHTSAAHPGASGNPVHPLSRSRSDSGSSSSFVTTPSAPLLSSSGGERGGRGGGFEPLVSPLQAQSAASLDANVAVLLEIMPELPREAAVQLLFACENDVGLAATTLIEMTCGGTVMAQQPSPTDLARPATPPPTAAAATTSAPVELVIYDLAPESFGKKVGLGAYHSGVHIFGREWSFGGSFDMKNDAGKSGVFSVRPYTAMPHLKKKILIGTVKGLTSADIKAWAKEWGATNWRVDDYQMLSKNCNHFSDMLLRRLAEYADSVAPPPPSTSDAAALEAYEELGDGDAALLKKRIADAFRLPAWVNRAASVGNKLVPDFLYRKLMQKLAPPGSTLEAPPQQAPPAATKAVPDAPASDPKPSPPPAAPLTPQQLDAIDTMIAVTQVDRDRAVAALQRFGWDLEKAVNSCF